MNRSTQILELEKDITHRVERLREQHISSVPYVSLERCLSLTNSFKKTEGDPKEIRRAKALAEILQNLSIDIGPDELIVGGTTTKPRGVHLFPEQSIEWLREELDTLATRECDPVMISEEDKEILRKEVFPYWEGKTVMDTFNRMIPEGQLKDLFTTGHISSRQPYYTIAQTSWFTPKEILPLGFRGLKMKAEHKIEGLDLTQAEDVDKLLFLEAVKIACDGATAFIKRYAALARELGESEANTDRKNELERIAETCEWISEDPPRTFQEVLQFSLFAYVIERLEASLNDIMCPGRFDQWLYPYYKKDIDEGRLTREEALELLECFYIKLCDVWVARPKQLAMQYGGYTMWTTTNIGGVAPDGGDTTNELSYLVLQAVADLRLHLPDIALRLHKETPDDFLMKACEVLRLGTGNPKFYNDEQIVPLMMKITNGAISLEQARDYYNSGCVELRLEDPFAPGFHLIYVTTSMAAPLEYVFTNGVARISGKRIGVETGDPRKFSSYEEVEEAFRKQHAHLFRLWQEAQNFAMAATLNSTVALPFASAMHPVCIENGVSLVKGAGLPPDLQFWFSQSAHTGLAEAADSLAAIKKLVFEDKVISMPELIDALDNDFEGREDLRQMLISSAPKYGNDDDYVDSVAKEVYSIMAEEHYKYRNYLGGYWVPYILTLTSNIWFGQRIGALPNGRKAWTPMADSSGPTYGYDRTGPTAVIKSCGKINRATLEQGTPITALLNMRVSPIMLEGDKGLKNMSAFLRAFCELGVFHVQFNVVSTEALRDAQAHPEKYPDLLVKVAGYSAYFTQLSTAIQDNIIQRTEHCEWR